MTVRALFLLPLLIGACTVQRPSATVQPKSWRTAATADDRERLRDWHASFRQALAAADRSGRDAEIAREGALLQPDAALVGAQIPNGDYRCRVIKVGAK